MLCPLRHVDALEILPLHLPSVRLGREARKVVDMERWRATLDGWKKSVFLSIPSGVDLDPIEKAGGGDPGG